MRGFISVEIFTENARIFLSKVGHYFQLRSLPYLELCALLIYSIFELVISLYPSLHLTHCVFACEGEISWEIRVRLLIEVRGQTRTYSHDKTAEIESEAETEKREWIKDGGMVRMVEDGDRKERVD